MSEALPAATVEFLADLGAHNERAWFDAHRDRYERDLVAPAKALVSSLAPALDRLSPGIRAEPRVLGSIFRINRDTRFSPDKRPYKDHLDLWFWHGERAVAVSGLFLRVSPASVTVGAGAHSLAGETLRRYRAAVCDAPSGRALAAIAGELELTGPGLHGRTLRRPPSGCSAPPEAAALLLYTALFAATSLPVTVATTPGLVDRLEHTWAPLVPLHEWLVAHTQA